MNADVEAADATRAPDPAATPVVALAGRPNTGKTTLFNALTGSRQRVGNFSGTTVEKAVGIVRWREAEAAELVDLPGTPSLIAASLDEKVAFDFIAEQSRLERPFRVFCVAEASNLHNDLPFAVGLRDCGYPVSLVVNMVDEAALNGIKLDERLLERELGVPVVLASGRTGQGVAKLQELMGAVRRQTARAALPSTAHELAAVQRKAEAFSAHVAGKAVTRERHGVLPTIERSISLDRVLFHPIAGPLILGAVLWAMFESLFTWVNPVRDLIATALDRGAEVLRPVLGAGLLSGLVCDGALPGISAVAQFVPQIAVLFAYIGVLEQSGYLPRAGATLDRALRPFGLDGKVSIPFLSSFACAIPGVMASRTLPSEKRRLTVVLLAPLMTCSARIPVYTLLIAAFVPKHQGLAMAAMYAFGVAVALVLALALKRSSLYERNLLPVTVLPPYRVPGARELARYVWSRCAHFLERAGKVIFVLSLFLWILGSFPRSGGVAPKIEDSALGMMGRAVEPVFAPIGYDWRLSVAVLSSLAAREVFVGTMGTILALGDEDQDGLIAALRSRYTAATAVSLLIFFAIALQCVSTLAIIRRETGGWKWPAIQFSAYFALAYVLSLAGYRLTSWLM